MQAREDKGKREMHYGLRQAQSKGPYTKCNDRWDPEPCAMAMVYCLLECLGCDALAAVCYFLYRGSCVHVRVLCTVLMSCRHSSGGFWD